MYSIFSYVTIESHGTLVRILSTHPYGTLSADEYHGFQHAIREESCAELAIVREGKVVCFL